MRENSHVRFGGRPGETDPEQSGHRAPGRPICTAPGYVCEVHHVDEWAAHHRTDIDTLTFACGPDHKLLEQGWTTRKNADGTTEWIPPPQFDFGKPTTNGYFHPERYFRLNSQDG